MAMVEYILLTVPMNSQHSVHTYAMQWGREMRESAQGMRILKPLEKVTALETQDWEAVPPASPSAAWLLSGSQQTHNCGKAAGRGD